MVREKRFSPKKFLFKVHMTKVEGIEEKGGQLLIDKKK